MAASPEYTLITHFAAAMLWTKLDAVHQLEELPTNKLSLSSAHCGEATRGGVALCRCVKDDQAFLFLSRSAGLT